METPDATKEETKRLSSLPDSISKKSKAVQLTDGGVVVVEKWSATKFLTVIDYVTNAVQGVPEPMLRNVGSAPNAVSIFKVLGERAVGLVQLSVRAEDADKIGNLDAEELVDVLDAILELNVTEKFLKKVKSLMGRFQQLTGTAGLPNTPSK